MEDGSRDITPYWRTLNSKGELNPKYPGGIASMLDNPSAPSAIA